MRGGSRVDLAHRKSALRQRVESSARLSASTLTRGSPRKPRTGPLACAATMTVTKGKLLCREAGAPIWLPLGPVTNETPGNPYMTQAVPDVLVKLIGTYWLPAAPPPTLVCRPTERFAVAQAARPDAAVDRAVGVTAGELVAALALGDAVPPEAVVAGVDPAALSAARLAGD